MDKNKSNVFTNVTKWLLIFIIDYILYGISQPYLQLFSEYLYKTFLDFSLSSLGNMIFYLLVVIVLVCLIILSFAIAQGGFKEFFKSAFRKLNIKKYVGLIVLSLFVWLSNSLVAGVCHKLAEKMYNAGSTTVNQANINHVFSNGSYQTLFIVLLSLILAPVCEELIFRYSTLGYLRKSILNSLPNNNSKYSRIITTVVLLLVSAAMFGLIHNVTNIFAFIEYAWMGLTFGIVYLIFDDVKSSMLCHAICNAMVLISMFFTLL